MSRRASLPGAAELFRRTTSTATGEQTVETARPGGSAEAHGPGPKDTSTPTPAERPLAGGAAPRKGSGRQKHDAKITVYLSGEELLAMEHARLALRGTHELVVDRGRIVREAVAVVLADFEQHGEDSVLVRRLRGGDPG